MASFCNSGTRRLANCIRVFEFDDYSDREYSETSPPRAVLIAKIDLLPGTQARPPSPHISAAACMPTSARLTRSRGRGQVRWDYAVDEMPGGKGEPEDIDMSLPASQNDDWNDGSDDDDYAGGGGAAATAASAQAAGRGKRVRA